MTTKPLFILVVNGGDGSYSPIATFDAALLAKLREAHRRGQLDTESCPGCDGDGFHYATYTVPESVTLESLGARALEDHWIVQEFLAGQEPEEMDDGPDESLGM